MLVAGPRGAGKSEFVKQLLSLKRFIMTNPPERIVWFYGRHQPDLFRSLTQEIPCIEFYEGLPTNIEVMFDRSKRNICIIDDLMQSASGNQLVENLFTNAGADPAQNLTGSNGNLKNFDRRKPARKIFRPARGSGGMLPQKILKIQLLIWAKIAFPALYYALSSQIFDNF